MLSRNISGCYFENLAAEYLQRNGYHIVTRNYCNVIGEIDIIAYKDETIIFIEVKGKNSDYFGRPIEMITPKKIRKVRQVATLFLKHQKKLDSKCRFDAIEVLGEQVRHIENCF